MTEKHLILVGEWIYKGNNDLRNAQIVIQDDDPPTDTVCFHCQQAVEKYLKAFLISNAQEPPRHHDLIELLSLCIDIDKDFHKIRDEAELLTKYGLIPRYPSDPPIYYAKYEAEEAIEKAKIAVDFVTSKIKR